MRETCNYSYTTAETNNLTLIAAAIELERPLEIFAKRYNCQGAGRNSKERNSKSHRQ